MAEVEFSAITSRGPTLASKITSITAPAKDATRLTLPQVPAGYSVAINSATPAGIIGLDGSIARPAADTFVSVVLSVIKTADGTTADTAAIKTFVPGTMQAAKITSQAGDRHRFG